MPRRRRTITANGRPTYVVDTNVLLRLLINDDPRQAAEAALLFQAADRKRVRLTLSAVVVFEAVFTLEKAYGRPAAAVGAALMPLFDHPSVEVQDAAVRRRALEIHMLQGHGFGDACVLATAERADAAGIATFDRDFSRRCPYALRPQQCLNEPQA